MRNKYQKRYLDHHTDSKIEVSDFVDDAVLSVDFQFYDLRFKLPEKGII